MNTSLGNTFNNQSIILFAAELYGIDEDQFNFVVEGDDGVIGTDDPDFLAFVAIVSSRLGLEMTYKIKQSASGITFCKQEVVLDPLGEWHFIRDPVSILFKMGWDAAKH